MRYDEAMRTLACALLVAAGCSGAAPANDHADLAASPDLAFPVAPHPGWPQFGAGDGVLLSPLTLVSIVAQNDTLGSKFLDFGDTLAASQWWKTVSVEPGLGAVTNVRVTGPAITANITASAIKQYIDALVSSKAAPLGDGHTAYVLYLPDNVDFVFDDNVVNTDCTLLEGIHFVYDLLDDNYAVVQRCFHNGQAGIDDATNTASHEIFEAATDASGAGWTLAAPPMPPSSGDPWLSAGYGSALELADPCSGTAIVESGAQFQRVFANGAAQAGGDPCVPAIASPYFNIAPSQPWTQVAAGQSVTITLTGWSTGATGDWYLDWGEITATGGKWNETVTGANTFTADNFTYAAVNNGTTATLTVTAPAGAASGSYDLLYLYSSPEQASATSDLYHLWPVGIYVP